MFSVPKQMLWYTQIFALQKSVKLATKCSLIQTKQTFGSQSSPNLFVEIARQLHLRFFLLTSYFFYIQRDSSMLSDLFQVPFDNRLWYICKLSKSFWAPVDGIFLSCSSGWSWILSSWPLINYKLRAASLIHKDPCFHSLQTLFVQGNIVREFHYHNVSFWRPAFSLWETFSFFYTVQYCRYWTVSAILLVDLVKWAKLQPQAERLQYRL